MKSAFPLLNAMKYFELMRTMLGFPVGPCRGLTQEQRSDLPTTAGQDDPVGAIQSSRPAALVAL
jgi:hypothetical protein